MKKRVLSIFGSSGVGGTELRAFQIACRLRADFDMGALFLSRPGPIQERYQREGIPHWTVGFIRFPAALRVIRDFKPDVIHLYGLEVNVIWRPLLYLLGYRQLIGHIAGLSNIGREPGWIRIGVDRLTYRFLRVYVSNSSTVADRLARFGFQRNRLHVIRNGVILHAAPPVRPTRMKPVIVSVGNLRIVKGYPDLLSALWWLAKQGVAFQARILGGGPEQASLQKLARNLNIQDHVQFYGVVDNARMPALLQESDIFALLSLSEGISGAAMEAMAMGLPVVATRVGGMPELITDGIEGYLVPPQDPAQAATRLAELLSDPALRQKMGRAARSRIETDFNLDRTVREYETLYLNGERRSLPLAPTPVGNRV